MSVDRYKKDVPLEAMRGVASFSVLAWHLAGAFFQRPVFTVSPREWFAIFTGPAAVNFFFVLSGLVLTRRALAQGDASALARSALKRWPRLAGPIVITMLLSYALYRAGLYYTAESNLISNSAWLQMFVRLGPVHPGFVDALRKGVFDVLFRGDYEYDGNLWTMMYEFRGSFLALGLAMALIPLRHASRLAPVMLAGTAILAVGFMDVQYLTFVAGVLLAAVLAWRPLHLPLAVVVLFGVVGLYLVGYTDGADYRGMPLIGAHVSPVMIQTVAALLILVAIEGAPAVQRALSGKFAVLLGRLSFPVYLVHTLVICSLGCATLVLVQGHLPGRWPRICAVLVSIAGTLAVAWPLAMWDVWWVRQVNRAAAILIPRAASEARAGKASGLLAGDPVPATST